jgi:hypothetical protein
MTLYFDLGAFAALLEQPPANRELLKRVPQRVAAYYLALPVGSEDDRVTVVTAYPDNVAGLEVLERLLRADVVPVSGSETALQQAIAALYPESAPAAQSVLVWADDAAWDEAALAAATAFGQAAGADIRTLDSATSLDEVVKVAGESECSLLVAHVSDEALLRRLVHRSPTSLLLVRGPHTAVDQLLVALRGYGSDYETLGRVLPILARPGAGATVLPLARSASSPLDELLAGASPVRQHLQAFLRDLDGRNVRLAVRLSQGDAATQIVTELAGGQYGLLVMAAEAEGRFVWQVLSRIEREAVFTGRPVLIVKPPVTLKHRSLPEQREVAARPGPGDWRGDSHSIEK